MKKNILIIVLGVITVACIIYGSYRNLFKGRIKWFDNDGNFVISSDETDKDFGKASFSEELNNFSKIKVDVVVAAVEIKEGSSFRIEATYNRENLKPGFEIKGDTLEVFQEKRRSRVGDNGCRVIITVPAGTYLDSVNITSNVGDIEIGDIKGKKLIGEVNVGEISADKIDFEEIEFETNVGEISVRLADGNIDDYDITLSADVGEVSVAGRTYKKSYSSRGKGNRRIRIDANVGAIKVR